MFIYTYNEFNNERGKHDFSEFGGITDTINSHICSSCPLQVVHIFTNLTYSGNAMLNEF